MKRLGLTMRIVRAERHGEVRDALAQDWAGFLSVALPEVDWLPIPNLGACAVDFARAWQLDGFIFTGGNDLGEAPMRDATEAALLGYALESRRPVFGVCRGLQFIQHFFGGSLQPCDPRQHVATSHDVTFRALDGLPFGAGETRQVNSFHNYGVPESALAGPLCAFAASADGLAEGIKHREAPVLAVQWHPERAATPDAHDVALMRWVLGLLKLGESIEGIGPRDSSPLTAARSPLRGEGAARRLSGEVGASLHVGARAGQANDGGTRRVIPVCPESSLASPSLLNGERAGVRGETGANAPPSARLLTSVNPTEVPCAP